MNCDLPRRDTGKTRVRLDKTPDGVPGNEGFLLYAGPAINLSFSCDCLFQCWVSFIEGESHGSALCRVTGPLAIQMILQTTPNISGRADVQRIIGASEDVDKRHKTTMPSSLTDVNGNWGERMPGHERAGALSW